MSAPGGTDLVKRREEPAGISMERNASAPLVVIQWPLILASRLSQNSQHRTDLLCEFVMQNVIFEIRLESFVVPRTIADAPRGLEEMDTKHKKAAVKSNMPNSPR
jgi:hypothetical protein